MAEDIIGALKFALTNLPVDTRMLSLSMKSLFIGQEYDAALHSDAASEFQELWDETRNDAVIYSHCMIPITTKFVGRLPDFFRCYLEKDYNGWKKSLGDLKKRVMSWKESANALLQTNEKIMVSLKRQQDLASVIINQLPHLEQQYEEKYKELEARAKKERNWAFALSFIPFVGAIAASKLYEAGDRDVAEAIRARDMERNDKCASMALAHSTVPALSKVTKSIGDIAGFFQIMEEHLISYDDQVKAGMEDESRLHYLLMKPEAEYFITLCKHLLSALQEARSDFDSIPKREDDTDHVQRWVDSLPPPIIGTVIKAGIGFLPPPFIGTVNPK